MSEPKRLFFAIELPAEKRQRQMKVIRRDGPAGILREVRCPPLDNLFADLAGRLQQPGFTLTLDDAGQWLRSRVVWLGTRQPPHLAEKRQRQMKVIRRDGPAGILREVRCPPLDNLRCLPSPAASSSRALP
jgi:2'-5' RNA ligase